MKNKVKLFLNPDPRELEEEINRFLKRKELNDWKIEYDLAYGGTCVMFSALLTYDDSVDWSPWKEEQVAIFHHPNSTQLGKEINQFLEREPIRKWKTSYATAYMGTCIISSVLIRYQKE